MPAVALPGWLKDWSTRGEWIQFHHDISREDIPLMVAAHSHQKWLSQIVERLEYPRPPRETATERDHCRRDPQRRAAGRSKGPADGSEKTALRRRGAGP